MPFIVLEGPDGSGTSFHTRTLAEALRMKGFDVLLTAEPTSGPIGLWIRSILQEQTSPLPSDALQLLFCADRAWHQREIREAMEEGKTVISDRYSHSTITYGEALGLDRDWLKEMNKNFIQPNKVIFALPPLKTCWERVNRREKKDSLEEQSLQAKVYRAYEHLASEDPSITLLDTSRSKGECAQTLWTHLQSLFPITLPSSVSSPPQSQ